MHSDSFRPQDMTQFPWHMPGSATSPKLLRLTNAERAGSGRAALITYLFLCALGSTLADFISPIIEFTCLFCQWVPHKHDSHPRGQQRASQARPSQAKPVPIRVVIRDSFRICAREEVPTLQILHACRDCDCGRGWGWSKSEGSRHATTSDFRLLPMLLLMQIDRQSRPVCVCVCVCLIYARTYLYT